ncbi:hypothetical protein GCM10022253_00830 [Sphingomonas endophytica]
MVPDEHLLHRVKRAGADVAIDDADRAQRQFRETAAVLVMHGAGLGADGRVDGADAHALATAIERSSACVAIRWRA